MSEEQSNAMEVQWNEQNWTVPASGDDWPFAAAEAIEKGQGATFLRIILGPAQMRQFLTGTRSTAGAAGELMNAILDASGAKSAGE